VASIAQFFLALIPSGTVVAYAGGVAPNGWHACDGTAIPRDAEFQSLRQLPLTHFPDLRKRFILGSGGGQDLNVAGGEEQVTLSIDHMPSHTHGVADPGHTHGIRRAAGSAHPGGPPWESWHGTSVNDPEYGGGQIVTNSRTNIAINNSGGNLAHNNMPPFYALMYIIKL
jgi:microcystin-dependent protein